MSEQNEKKNQELTIEDLEQVTGGASSGATVPPVTAAASFQSTGGTNNAVGTTTKQGPLDFSKG